jgi:murein L,D-transpeptidase YafK
MFALLALAAGLCPPEPAVVAELKAHRLTLCEAGQPTRTYKIAIGRNGIGKQVEGDAKSPVGKYPLGVPRASNKFWTFIPLGYPTAEEKRAGFTGADVGIHGPPRSLLLLGIFSTWVDWTAGCLAVGSHGKIDEIAAWVREKKPAYAELRAD